MDSKFKVGDEVVIVKYGHRFWSYEDQSSYAKLLFKCDEEKYGVYDALPDLVGQKGTVDIVSNTQGRWQYAINGPNKHAWYDEQQLEKVLSTSENKKARSGSSSKAKTDRAGR
jgi:hypothetical protein